MNPANFFLFMEEQEKEPCHVVIQGLRSPVGNQAWVKKLAIGMWTDFNDNDQGIKNATTKQIYGAGIPQRRPQQP